MKYPYLFYCRAIDHAPIFTHLKGDPFVADLSYKNALFSRIDVRDQKNFQSILEQQMTPQYHWGLAGYLERRDTLLSSCPQMVEEKRFFHLGLDVIAPLGTELHAPLNGVVSNNGYEAGEGNYGGYVLLKHEGINFETFYSFYGHLSNRSLPSVNMQLKAGDAFATIGDFHENGNWFHHTHIQVLTEKGLEKGYDSKGYCAKKDLAGMNDLCPSPIPLFKV